MIHHSCDTSLCPSLQQLSAQCRGFARDTGAVGSSYISPSDMVTDETALNKGYATASAEMTSHI